MKFQAWNGDKHIELMDCPFCGGKPEVWHIGNDHVKKREIRIKCTKCGVQRTDATLRFSFEWLEKVAAENWNNQI